MRKNSLQPARFMKVVWYWLWLCYFGIAQRKVHERLHQSLLSF